MRLLVLLLLAAPLSAQEPQTVVVPNVEITVPVPEVFNEVNIEVPMSDSIRDARIADALESIAAAIEAQGCDTCGGTSNVVRIGQGALVLAAFFIGWQLKRIADRPPDVHNDGDVTVPALAAVLAGAAVFGTVASPSIPKSGAFDQFSHALFRQRDPLLTGREGRRDLQRMSPSSFIFFSASVTGPMM